MTQPRNSDQDSFPAALEALQRVGLDPAMTPLLLGQAFQGLKQALRRNAQDYRACFGFGFLLALMQSFALARVFCQRGLQLHPGHPAGLHLLNWLLAQPDQSFSLDSRIRLDTEALSEGLETRLKAQLRQVTSSPHYQVRATLQTLTALEQLRQEIEAELRLSEYYLSWIEQDEDAQTLRQALRPLEGFHRRMQEHCRLAQGYSRISGEIARSRQYLQALEIELQSRQSLAPESLETLLDQCDSLADQLDELDQRQVLLPELRAEYRQLIRQVSDFQDRLEDL